MKNNEIIKISNVKKSFGKNNVINGVTLDIKKGERVCIIGINGGGKTTLLNMILGLYKVDSGDISYPYFESRREFLKNSGIQFQDSTLPGNYTVSAIFDLVYSLIKNPSVKNYRDFKKNDLKETKKRVLSFFDLDRKMKTKIKNLSGGQKQRLNILLSLINKPQVLILDELTTGLDIKAQRTLLKYINNYQKENESTTIIISHIVQEMESLADRIVLLDNGKISSDIKVSEIKKKYKTIERYLDQVFVPSDKLEANDE